MATYFSHPSVPALYKRLNREVSHRLAVIVFTDGAGYGFGVVEGSTGDCLAWDGIYFDEMPATTALDELDWDEWDDMSSKFVFQAQRDWLAGPLGLWLMPTYSVAEEAAELVSGWGDHPGSDGRHLASSTLRCYLPIVDESAYEEHLERRAASRSQRARSWRAT